jgi:A/G-specific adenine glycosylase
MKKITYKSFFGKNLMIWHKNDNQRKMPWKGEKDPYKIWLCEIILQQTRVEQGLSYYNKFITHYPTIEKLAAADENSVFKHWEGLGYYSRCKNLIATARFISYELNGVFPITYENILNLKGVGPYTAAAIASFAYNLPHAVIDGNVLRILARFYGKKIAIDSTEGKKYFTQLANNLLDKKEPALYNQAIMDFGATICKPQLPLCKTCILKKECIAFKTNEVLLLPIKAKKMIKTKRFFFIIIAQFENNIYVRKRVEKDVWQNLWEFISIEHSNEINVSDYINTSAFKKLVSNNHSVKLISTIFKQQLTHQTIEGTFIHVTLSKPLTGNIYTAISQKKINTLAFPRLITNYFEKK